MPDIFWLWMAGLTAAFLVAMAILYRIEKKH